MKKIILFQVFLALAMSVKAQAPPQSAAEIMNEALGTAAKENKKVFIMFHASWCGWCHKMDASMNDNVCKKFFDDNFIIRHLVVFESKGKENLENPGSLEMLTKYGGADSGIPYWLVFDNNGGLLADSRMPPPPATLNAKPANTGCPASKEEVDYFLNVLRKTTPLSENDLEIVRVRFRKNNPN